MKFREHRGTLQESMGTVVTLADRAEFLIHLCIILHQPQVFASEVEVKPYMFDERINWHTYIVTVRNYGVVGFTDGPLPEKAEEDSPSGFQNWN